MASKSSNNLKPKGTTTVVPFGFTEVNMEFYTTAELLEELAQRETFVGIVIVSNKEHVSQQIVHDDFKVITKFSNEQTAQVLSHVISNLE